MSQNVYIVAGSRTPMGGLGGSLASQTASQLGSVAITGALTRAKVLPAQVSEVYMGCVLAAGQGQAHPASGFRRWATQKHTVYYGQQNVWVWYANHHYGL